nr:hypothetical protein [Tanacetum cinerariifolium]
TKGYFPVAAEGSMQQTINELTALCTRLQRQYSELAVKFEAQGIEITRLKARLKLLEDKQGVPAEGSGDDAPIKGRNLDEEEAAAERASDDTEEMTTMLTSIDAAIVLASRAVEVPTGSGSIPTAGPPAAEEYHQFASELIIERRIELISDQQESGKKLKTSEEITEEAKSPNEVPKEKKFHTEGQRSYWKITRLGGSSASYQFFIDLLKHLDREELSTLYEPDHEDQLWTHTQNIMHAPVEWKLYDSCGVHHVTSKDKEIFMLVEKDYPLRKGLALVMISYKLQVENYS